eukprot:COSAG01_NODE_6374_length_3705_cov_3.149473_5_plen_340_part_00
MEAGSALAVAPAVLSPGTEATELAGGSPPSPATPVLHAGLPAAAALTSPATPSGGLAARVVKLGRLQVFRRPRYKDRFATIAGGLLRIYKPGDCPALESLGVITTATTVATSGGGTSTGAHQPNLPPSLLHSVAPKLTASIATMSWHPSVEELEGDEGRRLSVDTGTAVVVLRAPTVSERNAWVRALEMERAFLPAVRSLGGGAEASGDQGGGAKTLRRSVGHARATELPWQSVGPYRLATQSIGEGGFGYVTQGIHAVSHRRVAVKVLRVGCGVVNSAAAVRAEISTMSRLRHPNVVHLIDAIRDDGKVFLVMQLATGGELWGEPNGRTLTEKNTPLN